VRSQEKAPGFDSRNFCISNLQVRA